VNWDISLKLKPQSNNLTNSVVAEVEVLNVKKKTKLNSVALVRERTIPTERPPLVGEVSANFCG